MYYKRSEDEIITPMAGSAAATHVCGEAPLYARILGSDWQRLHPAIRRAHSTGHGLCARGRFRIVHGRSRIAGIICHLMPLPRESNEVDTVLEVSTSTAGEMWRRRFGNDVVCTTQRFSAAGQVWERLGRLELLLTVRLQGDGLTYRSIAARFRIGILRIPLPSFLAPKVEAHESPVSVSGTQAQVSVMFPGRRLLISYTGRLELGDQL
ncbi:MAG: DUF4166 domain-containing protein [Fimbriimonadales bacterium]